MPSSPLRRILSSRWGMVRRAHSLEEDSGLTASEAGPRDNEKVGYEPKDIDSFVVTAIGLALGLATLVAIGAMWFLFDYMLRERGERSPSASPLARDVSKLPPAPRLQASPAAELKAFREQETKLLGSYTWVDRQNGLASIPIDRAIDLVAQRGLPFRSGPRTEVFPPSAGTKETGYDSDTRGQEQ